MDAKADSTICAELHNQHIKRRDSKHHAHIVEYLYMWTWPISFALPYPSDCPSIRLSVCMHGPLWEVNKFSFPLISKNSRKYCSLNPLLLESENNNIHFYIKICAFLRASPHCVEVPRPSHASSKQLRQYTYKVTMRRVHATIDAVDKR
jgi:hypothetical protein